ncbi:MAG TPA: phosphopantetheine-binding protein, partial [Candidatus Krumholzibacteria bacterium]
LYRTGDRARYLPDGNLEFLGRLDHQVKLRGYRIELEEIEAALIAHDAVREAVVLAREDTPGDVRLVAYSTGTAHDPVALREHLAARLPDYMLPAHFVFLTDFPLLPNGKVDRRALQPPDQGRAALSSAYVEPATPLEKVLAVIWSDVLKVDSIGAKDDFFELGGHSILATQLFARMVDMLQVKAPLRAIFDGKTVRGLATILLSDEGERARVERAAELVLSVLES